MRKSLVVIISIVIVTLLVFVFGFSSKTNSPAPSSNPSTTDSQPEAPVSDSQATSSDQVTIIYTNDGFTERSYAIASGGTVTVQNKSTKSLEFSSDDHPAHKDNPELNTDVIAPGESVEFTPKTKGNWGFHNHLLSVHAGVLTVGL